MTTEVIMHRELFDHSIKQKSKSEMFSATDLVKAGNMWRAKNGLPLFNMSDWISGKTTKEFITALSNKFGEVYIPARGRGKDSWVHPYLFIDMALAISPELKIEVYGWLYDYLLKYRNDSGDSYKLMTGALYNKYANKREFPAFMSKTAEKIRKVCGITDDWQHASQDQLKTRDKIHEAIATLCEVLPAEEAVRVGIKRAGVLEVLV